MNKKNERNIVLQHYVASLVDVLGQQEALRQLDDDEDFYNLDGTQSKETFWKGVKRCYSEVENIRLTIQENINRWHPSVDDISEVSSERRLVVAEEVKHTVVTRTFSDLVLAYASLDRADTRVPIAQIWPMLCAVMFCQMNALANGCAIRGGIELGLGFEFANADLYGPVLSRVHSLESDVAKYPRVIVGPRLFRFVDHVAESGLEGDFSVLNQSMARNVRRAFFRDTDGLYILDFCGAAHHEWIKADSWPAVEMYEAANNFAHEQAARFAIKGNDKLGERYRSLSSYMQSRSSVWIRKSPLRAHSFL